MRAKRIALRYKGEIRLRLLQEDSKITSFIRSIALNSDVIIEARSAGYSHGENRLEESRHSPFSKKSHAYPLGFKPVPEIELRASTSCRN